MGQQEDSFMHGFKDAEMQQRAVKLRGSSMDRDDFHQIQNDMESQSALDETAKNLIGEVGGHEPGVDHQIFQNKTEMDEGDVIWPSRNQNVLKREVSPRRSRQ